MRITNKIIHNNSLYNININKTSEDTLNTMISTGKKITRPSDDPIIAIRALRLRSEVSQLSQYYEKNSKDAQSWLEVTEDALSTVSDVLTDSRKLCVKGANDDMTSAEYQTIITQLDALADEYYSTGNQDYSGRYIFTGYRTEVSLSFEEDTSQLYSGIADEFNYNDVDDSARIVGMSDISTTISGDPTEAGISTATVGRIRLSYSNLVPDQDSVSLSYRTPMAVSADTILSTASAQKVISLNYKDTSGAAHNVKIATGTKANNLYGAAVNLDGTEYLASANDDGTYTVKIGENTIEISESGVIDDPSGILASGSATISDADLSTVSFTTTDGNTDTITVPLSGSTDVPYTTTAKSSLGNVYEVTVNTDGTYTLTGSNKGNTTFKNVIQLAENGSAHASYEEHTVTCAGVIDSTTTDAEIDAIYADLADENSRNSGKYYFNAKTGELLLGSSLKSTLNSLKDLNNADSISVSYSKQNWASGDIRPENLFRCESDGVVYNGGSKDHIMRYDVGYNQNIEVNTTADQVFTTAVRRDVDDLKSTLNQLQQIETTLSNLQNLKDSTTDETELENLQLQIDAAEKARSYMKEQMSTQFGNKITSTQASLDKANVAVTENGTRSRRLELVQNRLQSQTTTFKTLQHDNEDADMAETATNLSSAELTYQAALMATGKIMQTSLMNYI